ncbi:MAG: TlpA disulfide reductase family protein [Solirubrobacterales bacterium]
MTSPDDREAPDPKRTTRQYSWLVGIVFLAFVVYLGVRSIDSGQTGGTGLSRGERAPKFAAPSATGKLDGDANIFQNAKQAGEDGVPACEVADKDAIRICDYFDRPLVLVAWFTKCGNCEQQLDIVDRVRRRFPNVAFVGLDVADSLENAGKTVAEHGWGFPMAVDRDGAVSTLYNVGVGPTTFFICPGGVVQRTALGELNARLLVRGVRRLVSEPRRCEPRPSRRQKQ